ncbi:MAG: PfkB family carbohydrate kinase [Acidimicrobiales bacterium]
MTGALAIPATGALDFLSLGSVVIRLDPGMVPFRKARDVAIHVSGGEYNVAANLSDCFGLQTAIATAMVDYPIGALVDERIRAMGVRPIYRHYSHDGVRGPNIAQVYSDRGYGVRPPVVFYNRANEAAARLAPGDFDWPTIFGGGLRWFHSGGIFAALSPNTSDLIIEAMEAAHAVGAVVSLDLNYRGKLWAPEGGKAQAQAVLTGIAEHVDVILGNEEDLQTGLGFTGPEVTAVSSLDPNGFLAMMDQLVTRFPRVRVVATTLREVRSANRHIWSAVAWVNGSPHVAPVMELDVYDRVGGGDGFAAGFIYGLLAGCEPDEALRLGWAHGALVATFPGDTTMATLEQVRELAEGGSARIQR